MAEHCHGGRTYVTRLKKPYLSLSDLKTPRTFTRVFQNVMFNVYECQKAKRATTVRHWLTGQPVSCSLIVLWVIRPTRWYTLKKHATCYTSCLWTRCSEKCVASVVAWQVKLVWKLGFLYRLFIIMHIFTVYVMYMSTNLLSFLFLFYLLIHQNIVQKTCKYFFKLCVFFSFFDSVNKTENIFFISYEFVFV